MATKEELLHEARENGLKVNSKTTKSDLEGMLKAHKETVEVSENKDGEATNGTDQEGQKDPVENTDCVPKNGVEKI
jgi:hypothetical protein